MVTGWLFSPESVVAAKPGAPFARVNLDIEGFIEHFLIFGCRTADSHTILCTKSTETSREYSDLTIESKIPPITHAGTNYPDR